MKKEYKAVQDLLGLEALVADKDNGCYFVEAMMDKLETGATELAQRSKTLDAKLQEVQELNATIAQLKGDVEGKNATIAEKENAIAELNEQIAKLNQTVADLTAKGEASSTTLSEKDTLIASLKAQNEELNKSLADKDAELSELGRKASAQPASTAEHREGQAEEKIVGPHNVTHAGMTLREKQEALENRQKELLGLR